MESKSKSKSKFEFPIVHIPVRSVSLPSRLHPLPARIEAILSNLKNLSRNPNSGEESIRYALFGASELYNCIDELMQCPQTQHSLARYNGGSLVHQELELSIKLLDMCSSSRDMLVTMREQVMILQSSLRRRNANSNSNSTMKTSIQAYLSFRRKAKRDINKSLSRLHKMESQNSSRSSSPTLLDQDHHLQSIVKIMREVTSITISILRSLFLFLAMPELKPKSVLTKLVPKLLSQEKERRVVNEVGCVDLGLQSVIEKLQRNEAEEEVQMVQKLLEALSVGIGGVEAGLDSNFRCLVKNRVSFLNILAL